MLLTTESRRGFTFMELLVVLALLLVVTGAVYRLLLNTQRVTRAQAERADLQANLRAGALIVRSDLRMIGYDSVVQGTVQMGVSRAAGTIIPDILALGPDSIVFRSIRASGMICAFPAANQIVVDTSRYYSGSRPIRTTDSLLLYFDVDPATSQDDSWYARPIQSVGPGTCPGAYGSRPGLTVTLPGGAGGLTRTGTAPPDSIIPGSPFRVFEVLVYRLYQSGGRWYLGARSASAGETGLQPVLGPLAPNGFQLAYFDATGTVPATLPSQVRLVRVTLVAESSQRVSGTGFGGPAVVSDSVVTSVALRNTLR